MACDSCHKFPSANWKEARKAADAFPDVTEYPEHSSCIGCHRAQFFARERPAPRICSICHTNVTPRDTTRNPFPSLGEIFRASKKGRDFAPEFRVRFPHDKHLEVVSGLRRPSSEVASLFLRASFARAATRAAQESDPKSCAVCHQTYQPQGKSADEYVTKPPANLGDAFWPKRGTFKTTPDTHAACFTCHSTETGIAPAPSDCAACHKLPPPGERARTDFDPAHASVPLLTDRTMLLRWRARDSSATFRHEGGVHPDLSCTACHNVAAMDTANARTLRVPVLSCGGAGAGCHVTASADEGGMLNFEVDERRTKPSFQCAKCHLVYGREPVPKSHTDALKAATEAK